LHLPFRFKLESWESDRRDGSLLRNAKEAWDLVRPERDICRRGDRVATNRQPNRSTRDNLSHNYLILLVPQEGFEPQTPSLRIKNETFSIIFDGTIFDP
jgi:hypothetical protein